MKRNDRIPSFPFQSLVLKEEVKHLFTKKYDGFTARLHANSQFM